MFCRSLFVLLPFFFRLWCCLSFLIRDRIVVGFTTTYAITVYHYQRFWVRIPLKWGVLDTKLYDKVSQWLTIGQWFSPRTPVSSTIKTDHMHDDHDRPTHVIAFHLIITFILYLRIGVNYTDYPSYLMALVIKRLL
jgi:hypothetical protein